MIDCGPWDFRDIEFLCWLLKFSNWGGRIIIGKNEKDNLANKEEGQKMAVLAKPINRIAVIKEKESQKFVREFNENKVSKDFLDSCKKAGKLFGKRK